MILIRRGLFISRNVIKCARADFCPRRIAPFSMIMQPESTSKNIEEKEDPIFPKLTTEFFPFRDPKISAIKNLEGLQKLILKKKNSLTATQIITILQQMHLFFYDENWSRGKVNEIKNSIEFHVLLGTFKQNLEQIDMNELVPLLIFFAKLDIPHTSQLMQDIRKQLTSKVNDITFTKSAMLYNYFTRQKINNDLKELLKNNIENHIIKYLRIASDGEIAKAAYYASVCDFSVECMIQLLNILLFDQRPIWNEAEILGNTFKILTKVKDHEKFPELEKQFFEILNELKKDRVSVNNFCHLIYVYGNQVCAGKTVYDENLINDLVDLIMKEKVHTTKKLLCLEGLISMKHIRHDFIRRTKNSVLMEKEFVNKNGHYFAGFVRALGESNYFSVKPDEFDTIKTFVENLEIYANRREMKRIGFDKKVSAAVDLLSLGMHPLQFFENLSKEIDSRNNFTDFHGGRLVVALLINEALSVLRTPFKKKFLSEQIFFKIINKLNASKTVLFEERLKWLSAVKESLESSINQKNCMLQNCRTKHGQEIHFVIAINDHGDIFHFEPMGDKINIIENIQIPFGYNLVLVNFVAKNSHNRNTRTVGAFYTLKLKILKEMGYRTLTVLNDEWTALPESERANYFWDRVRNEKTDLVLINTQKFIGEDKKIQKKSEKKEESNDSSESGCDSDQWVKLSE